MNCDTTLNTPASGKRSNQLEDVSVPSPIDPNRTVVQLFLGSEGGGIITAVNQWVPVLEQAGWDLRFVVMAEGGTAVDMLRRGGHEVIAQSMPRIKRFTKLTKLLASLHPAVIHVHNPSAQLSATMSARRLQAGLLRTVHADMFEEMRGTLPGWKIALWKRLMRWMIGRADAVGVVSPHLIPLVPTPRRFDKDRLMVMPNGYDPSYIENDDLALSDEVVQFLGDDENAKEKCPVILSMGRLVCVKNFQLLLRAFKRLRGDVPTARLILAGSGPLGDSLTSLADEIGIGGQVLFLSWVDHIAPLLKRASVIAISSTSECCPMLVLEAMSVAKPVVATKVGGIPYMIENDRNGLLVPSNDEKALADALTRVLSNDDLARRLGDANRDVLEQRYSPSCAGRLLAETYNNIMSRRHITEAI